MQYESNKSLEETIREFEGYIGYVYPHGESSYFICSGGRMKLSYVRCSYCRCLRKEITRRFKIVGGMMYGKSKCSTLKSN